MNYKLIKKLTLIIFSFFVFNHTFGQGYKDYKKIHKIYKNLHVADSLYETKDDKSVIKFYKKSKDACFYQDMMISPIMRCYIAMGDTVKASELTKYTRKQKVEENIIEEYLKFMQDKYDKIKSNL
jgi:hypothetical protein